MLLRCHQHLSGLLCVLSSCTFINSLPAEHDLAQYRTFGGPTGHLPLQRSQTASTHVQHSLAAEKLGARSMSSSALGDLRASTSPPPTIAELNEQSHSFSIQEIQHQWNEKLRKGMAEIENWQPKLARKIKESEVFRVIPTVFAMMVRAHITLARRISKRAENDWDLMDNFPNYLLEKPEKFHTLSHDFCIPEFPTILREKTAREFCTFAAKLAAKNNELSRVLWEELKKDQSKLPQFLENVQKVDRYMENYKTSNQIENDSDDYLEKIGYFIREDYLKRKYPLNRENHSNPGYQHAENSQLQEIRHLQYLTSKKELELEKMVQDHFSKDLPILDQNGSKEDVTGAFKVLTALNVLKRISARSLHVEIFEVQESVERMDLKPLIELVSQTRVEIKMMERIKRFSFRWILESRNISDLYKYELEALKVQNHLQNNLLDLFLKTLKSEGDKRAIQSVIASGKDAQNGRNRNPTFPSDLSDEMKIARESFDDLWPLPLNQNEINH